MGGFAPKALASACGLLDTAEAFAQANDISQSDLLDWRLIGEMQPLTFQIMVVANFGVQWPARAAGIEGPTPISADLTLSEFRAALCDRRAFLDDLQPSQFESRDAVPIQFRVMEGLEPTLPALRWLSVFANTNLFFHLSTAYGILRSNGVPLGKTDMCASRL